MSKIPTKVTKDLFEQYISPYLSKANRGFVCSIPLYKVFNYILYFLHTGCQWAELPIAPAPDMPEKPELSYHAVYYHYRKWSKDGSLETVWKQSLVTIQANLNLSEINFDGTHILAKKGGESVAYQGRKKAKTSNILPFTEANGYIIASTELVAGNHNDAFNLKPNLQTAFKELNQLGLGIHGAFFNADSAFDTKDARKTCFNHGLIPNMPENKRNRKRPKRGRKRLFNKAVYTRRFCVERTFAWIDKFKRLLIRFERKDKYFFGGHCIAFAMINLRHKLA
jgi:transposase